MNIYYIGYYERMEDIEKYKGVIPARLKMDYIAKKINMFGYSVNFLSLSSIKQRIFTKPNRVQENINSIYYIASLNERNKISKVINSYLRYIQVLLFFCKIKKGDIVLLYHNLSIAKTIWRICKRKSIKVILQVEEVYGYSAEGIKPFLSEEIEIIKKYDHYILVNDYIPISLNLTSKNYMISYGVTKECDLYESIFDNQKIHVVYAGTIENKKMGAITSVKAGKYLPNNYVVHILGFGKKENIDVMLKEIEETNKEAGYQKVIYHGQKNGDEVNKYLCSCDIGISPNVLNENFTNHTFPSKVMSYMSNGLKVVVGYGKALDMCSLSNSWTFYHEFSPEAVAEAIENAKNKTFTKEEIREEVKKYDEMIQSQLDRLFFGG